MEIQKNMTSRELIKAAKLITKVGKLGIDLNNYGEIGVDPNSGNTYLWSEDINFCLFIGLSDDKVKACYSCGECGEEFIINASSNKMSYYEKWIDSTSKDVGDGYRCLSCIKK